MALSQIDIHLTRDKEIVLLHDPRLDRTTNGKGMIKDTDWYGDLEDLRTKKGDCKIPRLNDVLDLLMRPDVREKNVWFVLDIKADNPPEILSNVHALLNSEAYKDFDFSDIITFGVWTPNFLPLLDTLFPTYNSAFIGVTLTGASLVFFDKVKSFNLNFACLVGKDGTAFIKKAHMAGKNVFVWTVNDPNQARECVRWGVDAVLGDDVNMLLDVCCREGKTKDGEKVAGLEDGEWHTMTRSWYYYGLRSFLERVSKSRFGV
ncbi:hypothetical protein BZG36_02258 [Bifiguratus adelaidae]|uniref:GP-PDE domain-containing protein n=1 Tax=Bifiguratus adelaidae TaxID=1938954 RepID=A0A261Y1M8_9FUNG|nr:hypothetical protein BZG36_02258 [Bifiguratus adelaidae]